ncbi:hypothetical protein GCM10020254_87940 [Streptomyces goshikiensis]
MAVEENVGLELPDIPEVQEGEPDAVYRLDAEDAARAGLSEDDIQIKTFWWKFEIHLSAQAADIAAEITELVGKVLAKVPKLKPFSPIIKAFCRLKAKWIRDVSAGKGCKLVSPWFAPGMLIPVQLKTPPDYYLYWCVYDPPARLERQGGVPLRAGHDAEPPGGAVPGRDLLRVQQLGQQGDAVVDPVPAGGGTAGPRPHRSRRSRRPGTPPRWPSSRTACTACTGGPTAQPCTPRTSRTVAGAARSRSTTT